MEIKEKAMRVLNLVRFPAPVATPAADVTILSKQDIMQNLIPVKSVHASTVLPLDDGTVLAAWFGGTSENASDVRIWYSKRDKSGRWSDPASVPSDCNVAHWNPVLDRRNDGSVRLFYKKGAEIPCWETWYTDSLDAGKTWTAPKPLVSDDEGGGRGPVKNKCIRTKEGLLLAPASTEQNADWKTFVDVSRDDGDTWTPSAFVDVRNPAGEHVRAIQPTLWQDDEGAVHFLCRTMSDGYIFKCDSFDGGFTWGKAYRTAVPNNNSGIDCVRSDDGRVWLLCNPVSIGYYRSPLRLLVSYDNGFSFLPVCDLERRYYGEFSYPAITAMGDRLFCTYTNLRKNITFVEIKI